MEPLSKEVIKYAIHIAKTTGMHVLATQPFGNLVLGQKRIVFLITPRGQLLATLFRVLHLLFFLVRKRRVGRKTGEGEIVGR